MSSCIVPEGKALSKMGYGVPVLWGLPESLIPVTMWDVRECGMPMGWTWFHSLHAYAEFGDVSSYKISTMSMSMLDVNLLNHVILMLLELDGDIACVVEQNC